MISKLSNSLTQYICRENISSIDDMEKINYAIFVILSECSKICFLFIFFLLIGVTKYFLFSMTILLSIRIFAGGFHAESSIQCLIFSTLFFLCTCIFVFQISNLSREIYYIVAAISIIFNVLFAPKASKNRPIVNKKRRLRLRFISIISTTIWIYVLFFFIQDINLFKCGIGTVFLQSIQLISIKEIFTNEK